VTTAPLRAARPFLAALLLALAAAPAAKAQVQPNQTDTFQDGTTQNWTNGPLAPDPINVPTGGPAGAGDHFLQFSATGVAGDAGGRLTIFNRVQWAGNFVSAGVTAVEMDLQNLSGPTLQMRVALKGGTLQTSPGYVSTNPFALSADGLWHHVTFRLDAADLTGVNGPAPLDTFLTNVAEFRILSAAGPALNGDMVAATAGVDNIHAVAPVPEPGSLLLTLAGAGFLGGAVLRARRGK
jgi:hypothetical protein